MIWVTVALTRNVGVNQDKQWRN